MELNDLDAINQARDRVSEDLKQIQTVADQSNATVVLAMVPSSVQVCSPDQLDYYPHNIDLNDSTRFDVSQPQRIMSEIADSQGLPLYDLRDALSSTGQCLYQPRNMHWLADGHRVVSAYLADVLTQAGYVP